ncbi:glycosyltransferase family 4 protein [Collinsella tanakaei]|nr:glycosyltransferase family 4 protein [Collinsella tanakaei]
MNLVISDMESVPDEFMSALSEKTGLEWSTLDWQSNQPRAGIVSELKRYATYIFRPLSVVFRKDLDRIVTWQQFYGISYAFWSRLLRRPKTARLTVMTFIYKPKGGHAGRVYERFIGYALRSRYIDTITRSSSAECDRYSEEFDVPRERFAFVPWCVEDRSAEHPFDPSRESGYVLASGRSNRDYPLLIEAATGADFRVKIIDDTLGDVPCPPNVELIGNAWGGVTLDYLANCGAFAIPIGDPDVSAGQTVLLQAWSFGKPVVCTRGAGLSDDYIEDGADGLLVGKDAGEMRAALERLIADPGMRRRLGEAGHRKYEEGYSLSSLGRNVGETFA